MSKPHYEGPNEFKPISAWGYIGYTILFAIPVLGFILLLVFAFSKKKINRRNFARSFLCYILIAIILFLGSIVLTRLGVGDLTGPLKLISPQIKQSIESIENLIPASVSNAPKAPTTSSSSTKASAVSQSVPGVRPEVKAAIDGYVAFFEEYAAFMKKSSTSSNALTMLADYAKMLSSYEENMKAWEKFETKYPDLNDAELKYYTDATLRIEKALLNVI